MDERNPCQGCLVNCCSRFGINLEAKDPKGVARYLKKFPFIHPVGLSEVEVEVKGYEKNVTVNVYECDEFDPVAGVCLARKKKMRIPKFCKEAGTDDNFPNDDCLLKPANQNRQPIKLKRRI